MCHDQLTPLISPQYLNLLKASLFSNSCLIAFGFDLGGGVL